MRILLNTAVDETATGSVENATTTEAVTETAPNLSGAKEPTSADEVITAAADGVKPATDSPTDEKKDEVKVETETEETTETEKTDETTTEEAKVDEALPPFHEHEAWKAKVQKVTELEQQVATLSTAKQTLEGLNNYRQQHNITDAQFSEVMEIAALLNSDPQAAWTKLQPIVETLSQVAGDGLPADLKAKVDAGTLDNETATELAKLRAMTKVTTARAQVSEQQRVQQSVQATQTALKSWDDNKRTSDPDFAMKSDAAKPDGKWEFVRDRFNLKLQSAKSGQPITPADVVKMAEDAYKEVSAAWRKPSAPPTKKPLTSTGSTQTTKQEFKSPDDVINAMAAGHKVKV